MFPKRVLPRAKLSDFGKDTPITSCKEDMIIAAGRWSPGDLGRVLFTKTCKRHCCVRFVVASGGAERDKMLWATNQTQICERVSRRPIRNLPGRVDIVRSQTKTVFGTRGIHMHVSAGKRHRARTNQSGKRPNNSHQNGCNCHPPDGIGRNRTNIIHREYLVGQFSVVGPRTAIGRDPANSDTLGRTSVEQHVCFSHTCPPSGNIGRTRAKSIEHTKRCCLHTSPPDGRNRTKSDEHHSHRQSVFYTHAPSDAIWRNRTAIICTTEMCSTNVVTVGRNRAKSDEIGRTSFALQKWLLHVWPPSNEIGRNRTNIRPAVQN